MAGEHIVKHLENPLLTREPASLGYHPTQALGRTTGKPCYSDNNTKLEDRGLHLDREAVHLAHPI